jgi:hypothetical protein
LARARLLCIASIANAQADALLGHGRWPMFALRRHSCFECRLRRRLTTYNSDGRVAAVLSLFALHLCCRCSHGMYPVHGTRSPRRHDLFPAAPRRFGPANRASSHLPSRQPMLLLASTPCSQCSQCLSPPSLSNCTCPPYPAHLHLAVRRRPALNRASRLPLCLAG